MALFRIETNGKLEPALQQEWLLTNGIGGFASSSAVGCNRRRYHGMLCAATIPPVGRMMTVNRVAEILLLDGASEPTIELSINQFGNSFHPRGDQYLRAFEVEEDSVRWEYQVAEVRIVKECRMYWGKNATGLRYTIDPGSRRPVEIRLLPFLSMRDFHALRRGGTGNFKTFASEKQVTVSEGELSVSIQCDNAAFEQKPDWWYGHTYAIETERGQDDREDLFVPGRFVLRAIGPTTVTLWMSTEPLDGPVFEKASAARPLDTNPRDTFPGVKTSVALRRLAHAAGDFVVTRKGPDGKPALTVIAGYPWFGDWGRDTMIALPGLLLSTGKLDQARAVLCLFAQYVSEGMIPNRFDDYTNQPSYNTVDASLWFIHACFEYLKAGSDRAAFDSVLRPACAAIVDGYKKGTRYRIKMDESDGLLSQGDESTQLTWMDAKCNDVVFTPRQGKAVEINALWFNALKLLGDDALAEKTADSFRRAFWISPFRGLADVVDGNPWRRDSSMRPNQIFAVSLPNSPLTAAQQMAVVETVRRELLTPMGLRSLNRGDPRYKPHYTGDGFSRDSAYHNGTVWAWPLGSFLHAWLKVNNRTPAAIEQARQWLSPLIDLMGTGGCIGQVGEIFDADPPHRPVGCFAQAWSVAEALRLAVELGM
jgi:predicted glycogen debranching enzyme